MLIIGGKIPHAQSLIPRIPTMPGSSEKVFIFGDKDSSSKNTQAKMADLPQNAHPGGTGEPIQPPPTDDTTLQKIYPESTITDNSSDQPDQLFYNDKCSAPFVVNISKLPVSDRSKIPHIHPLQLSRILRQTEVNGIVSIIKVNRNTSQVKFNSLFDANSFIANHKLDRAKYSVFIPKHRILKKGILKDIPPEYSEKEIREMISCEHKVYEVKRIHKYDPIKKTKYPLPLMVVTFVANSLPEKVKLDYYIAPIELYINPVQLCFNCFKFGHLQRFCRSKKRCQKCGDDFHELQDCPKSELSCLNCKGPHLPTNRSCPSRKEFRKVNGIMAESNISFKEALAIKDSYSNDYKFGNNKKFSNRVKTHIVTNSNNRFTALGHEEFPELNNSRKVNSSSKQTSRSKSHDRLSYPKKKRRADDDFPSEWVNRLKSRDPPPSQDNKETNSTSSPPPPPNETDNTDSNLEFVGLQVDIRSDSSPISMDTSDSHPDLISDQQDYTPPRIQVPELIINSISKNNNNLSAPPTN